MKRNPTQSPDASPPSAETIKVPALTRELEIEDFETRLADGKGSLFRIAFSASSTYRAQRVFGDEILDHDLKAVRLERANRGVMPLLFNHDLNDPIGMVDSARIDNERLMIQAHLFETERGQQVRTMIEGGMRTVSLGYKLHKIEQRNDGSVIVRDWEPLEASIATVPIDPTVGIGRQFDEFEVRMIRELQPAKTAALKEPQVAKETAAAGTSAEVETESAVETRAEARIKAGRQALEGNVAMENERRRMTGIRNLGKMANIGENTIETWIALGKSVEDAMDEAQRVQEERRKVSPQSVSYLNMTPRETGRYSLCRAILASRDSNWKDAGFELECHKAIADKSGKPQEAFHFYVPLEVQRRQMGFNPQDLYDRHPNMPGYFQRDLNVAAAGSGGFLVQTSIMGFDEILRNVSCAMRLGATRLTGLRDNITIPRQSAAATAEWLTSETDAPAESQQTFVQLAMTPKTVAAYTELSRKLLLQASIDVEGLVNADLAAVVGLAVDLAAFTGTGLAGQPMGIDTVPGVGAVAGAALGLAGLLECQTDLATGNVIPLRGGYVTTPAVAGIMIAEVLYAGTASPAWVGNIWSGTILTFPALSSNQITAATMYFGDWSKMVIGEWGVLEVNTNPYAGFTAGIIGVRAMYSVDVALRYPVAFTIVTNVS